MSTPDEPTPVVLGPNGIAPGYLDVLQAAARVGVNPVTLRAWCAAGKIPGAFKAFGRKRGGAWNIPPAALDALARGELDTAFGEETA